MSVPWLEELNPAQRDAVTHGDGPLLVVAGAGTGKTKTLACRVAWLIEQGVSPQGILLLTFSRRAAAEMLRRAAALLSRAHCAAGGRVWGGTFHSVANRLLRTHGRILGVPPDFTVMDQSDAADLLNLIRSDLGLAKGDRRFPRKETLASIYSRTVNSQQNLVDVLRRHFPWCQDSAAGIAEVFGRYVQLKRERNVADYDDLLLLWSALCSAPGVGDRVGERFQHVLVDEYQDTNAVQANILLGMRRSVRNVMAVGDDAQSIYSFRAATIRNILDFPRQFEGTRVITLEQNYRSTRPILDVSNAVMTQARERFTKNLWSQRTSAQKPLLISCFDEPRQCDAVCGNVLRHLEEGIPLRRQAVLFRTGHHSDQLEVELSRRNIPFVKYGGLKFIESGHIKDLLALLRILENPSDEISWFRVLLLLDGIGPASARRIMDALGVRRRAGAASSTPNEDAFHPQISLMNEVPLAGSPSLTPETGQSAYRLLSESGMGDGSPSPLRLLAERPPSVPAAARGQFDSLRNTLAECLDIASTPSFIRDSQSSAASATPSDPDSPPNNPRSAIRNPQSLTYEIELLRQFYGPILERRYDNAAVRIRDLEQLAHIAAGFSSRGEFLAEITLDPPAAASDLAQPPHLEEDYLILSTIHSAKGCEWDVVHIIHAADGMIPSDMAVADEAGVDEERRLFYVALTRAKDWLYVYFPLRYYNPQRPHSDVHLYAQLTRFITRDVRALLENQTERIPPSPEYAIAPTDWRGVGDSLGRLWRA